MRKFRALTIAIMSLLTLAGGAGTGYADVAKKHVVDAGSIQARIERQLDTEAADRQAVQLMLQNPEVRQIAAEAGLDLGRASAAAAVLSGPELKDLAGRAAEINAGLGGHSTVVISTTAIIIILLIIILIS